MLIRSERIIFRLRDKQALKPRLRRRLSRNVWRVDMKAFCRAGKHPRCRPLARPHPYFTQTSVFHPCEFTEETTMPLWKNPAMENFDTGNPHFIKFAPLCDEFTSLDAARGEALRGGLLRVIALCELRFCGRFKAVPKVRHDAEAKWKNAARRECYPWVAYQRTVSARPSSTLTVGVKPRSCWIFEMSAEE